MRRKKLIQMAVRYSARDGDAPNRIVFESSRPELTGFTPRHLQETVHTRDGVREICSLYWKSVWPLLSDIGSATDEIVRQNAYARIRELSVGVSRRLFDDATLNFIWGLAKDTEVLSILTEMTEVPWEALINHEATEDAPFLSEVATVSRCLFTQNGSVPARRSSARASNNLLFVDNVLHDKWSGVAPLGSETPIYKKLTHREKPNVPKTIHALITKMRECTHIRWICENEYIKVNNPSISTGSDRLRICADVHCTVDTILASRISPRTVVFLFSCAGEFNEGGSGIAAQIALYNASTVVSPLVPVSETVALQMLYLLSARIRILRAQKRNETISELISGMRRWRVSSSLRIWSSFIAIYGPTEAKLT
jgi:hypothetical protein